MKEEEEDGDETDEDEEEEAQENEARGEVAGAEQENFRWRKAILR